MVKEFDLDKNCKCGNHFKLTIGSPDGNWWFSCGKCNKYYWHGLKGFLGSIRHKYFGSGSQTLFFFPTDNGNA
jgi:hypothetical protein